MAAKRPVAGLAETVAKGDFRASLEALRDCLAAEIERADDSAAPVAALSRQLVDVLGKLNALPDAKKESTVDELAKRRAARRSTTKVSKRAAAGVKRGAGGGRARS